MPRKPSTSSLKSKVRRAEREVKQSGRKLDRELRKLGRKTK